MMKNNVKTFGSAYEAPEVQVTEVLVEQGFIGSGESELEAAWGGESPASLIYGEDYNDFQ